jgi:hypothetical protein
LLGPRVLAPVGLSDAVSTLLAHLPDTLKQARKVRVFTPPHTQKVAQQVQAWRLPTNPIDVHSFTHNTPPPPDTELIITMPRAEDAPRIAARLLTTTIPFAILVPSDLAPRIPSPDQFSDQPDLRSCYDNAGKIVFSLQNEIRFRLIIDRGRPLAATINEIVRYNDPDSNYTVGIHPVRWRFSSDRKVIYFS